MALEDRIYDLVRQSLIFDHLMEMGLLSGGKASQREACRRNAHIVSLKKSLNISSKELHHLKAIELANGWRYPD